MCSFFPLLSQEVAPPASDIRNCKTKEQIKIKRAEYLNWLLICLQMLQPSNSSAYISVSCIDCDTRQGIRKIKHKGTNLQNYTSLQTCTLNHEFLAISRFLFYSTYIVNSLLFTISFHITKKKTYQGIQQKLWF